MQNVQDLVVALKRLPYFAALAEDRLSAIASEVRVRRYDAKVSVVTEGKACHGLPFVISGQVKVFKINESGREQVLRIIGAGRTFNDVPVFDGGTNPGNVVTLEPSTIGWMPKQRMLALASDEAGVAIAVIRVLATRLRALTVMVEDLALRGVTARIASLLLDVSRGHPQLAEVNPGTRIELTQERLAAMAGSVREVVHRALKLLEREGAIAIGRGRIEVLEPAILETWSDTQRTQMN